jgi:hypothetical protein
MEHHATDAVCAAWQRVVRWQCTSLHCHALGNVLHLCGRTRTRSAADWCSMPIRRNVATLLWRSSDQETDAMRALTANTAIKFSRINSTPNMQASRHGRQSTPPARFGACNLMETTMTERYPTWIRINGHNIISEEEMDGTPDFFVSYDKPSKQWWVKWRTSACWTRGFKTASAAMRYVEQQSRS